MAKKNKDDNEEEFLDSENEKEGGSGFVTALTVIIIVVIWLVIFGILIKTDFMGFGSSVLAPVLEDVPVINRILPNSSSEGDSGSNGSATGINDNVYDSLEAANAEIRELQAELIEKTEEVEENKETISSLKKQVSNLKPYKRQFDDFDDLKKAFDEEVVFGDSALPYEEYMKFYEEIEPENAEEIYRQCVEQQQGDAKVQAQAAVYAAMDPSQAAAILGNMTGDIDLVCQILSGMKEAQSAEILASMDTNFASKITKKMMISE